MNLIDVMGLGTVALRGICRLNVRFGSRLCKNASSPSCRRRRANLSDRRCGKNRDAQAAMARTRPSVPMILIIRFML